MTALVVAIMVMWGIRASTSRWIPTGDDAFLSLRTRHVLSSDPILLNNASSAGPSAGSQYNHPGAFPLTLLSPVTLLGGPGSLALATALVNAAWVALISWMVRRVAGLTAQLGAVLATEKAAAGMVAGTHGSTYGGNPLACAVGAKVMEIIEGSTQIHEQSIAQLASAALLDEER